MRLSFRICLSAIILLAVLGTTTIFFRAARPHAHPQFGDFHHSAVDQEGDLGRVARWIDEHSPISLRLQESAQRHAISSATHIHALLPVATNELFWSSANGKTGWIMFWTPPSTNGVWEFALCARTNLKEVKQGDLNTTFVIAGGSQGPTVFGANWGTNAIRVTEGQIVLARRVGQMNPIYVIRFSHQSGHTWGKVEIDYLVAPADKPANPQGGANGRQPFRAVALVSLRRLPPVAHPDCWAARRRGLNK